MKIASIQPKIEAKFLDTVDGQFRLMNTAADEGAEVMILPELATPRGEIAMSCKWDEPDYLIFDYQ